MLGSLVCIGPTKCDSIHQQHPMTSRVTLGVYNISFHRQQHPWHSIRNHVLCTPFYYATNHSCHAITCPTLAECRCNQDYGGTANASSKQCSGTPRGRICNAFSCNTGYTNVHGVPFCNNLCIWREQWSKGAKDAKNIPICQGRCTASELVRSAAAAIPQVEADVEK